MAVALFQRSPVVTLCTTLYDTENSGSSDHTVYLRVSNDPHSNQLLYSRRAALSPNTVRVPSEDGPQFLIQINCCLQMVTMPCINPLNPELNPICYLLALLGAHRFLHVSRIRVKLLTFRLLMSYKYGAPILDVSRLHTTTQHSR